MITCPTNEFYGHAEIFRKYAGIDKAIPIDGRLQHGWSGIVAGDSLDRQGINLFIWQKNATGYNIGSDEYPLDSTRAFPIGAPILYLPQEHRQIESKGTLAIPIHSIAENRITKESWEKYCEYLLYTYGAHTTVLVHPRDVELGYDKISSVCYGLRTLCCGRLFDRNYLQKQVAIIRSFKTIALNALSTAAFYALYLDKTVRIDRIALDIEPPPIGYRHTFDFGWMDEHYPSVMRGTCGREVGLKELGAENVKSPEEIKRLMFSYASL